MEEVHINPVWKGESGSPGGGWGGGEDFHDLPIILYRDVLINYLNSCFSIFAFQFFHLVLEKVCAATVFILKDYHVSKWLQ